MPVNRRLARIGPRKNGMNTIGQDFAACSLVAGIPYGAPRMNTPPHEIRSVTTKKVNTGLCMLIDLSFIMIFFFQTAGWVSDPPAVTG